MSLIINLHGEEGIVMAGDSRLSLDNVSTEGETKTIRVGVMSTDTVYKVFAAGPTAGLAYCGAASIRGVPLAGFVQTFVREHIEKKNIALDDVPQALVDYFRAFDPIPDTIFHLAGYTTTGGVSVQKAWRIGVLAPFVAQIVPTQQARGAFWDGERDVLTRLVQPQIHFKEPNGVFSPVLFFSIPFDLFTLQDMIDFAAYAIRTTTDSMRFQMRAKTVGGPIDILVIKPDGITWIARKQLGAP